MKTKEGTFYPAGTKCYLDPSQSSCFLFGNSGSGVARRISPDNAEKEQYAFTGPLSMSKSCDNIFIFDEKITYGAENPGIFTDAHCYLPWIAEMYGMKLPDAYTSDPSCSQAHGDRRNINKDDCLGRDTHSVDIVKCDFNYVDVEDGGRKWDRCRLSAQEGFAYNIYTCKVKSFHTLA